MHQDTHPRPGLAGKPLLTPEASRRRAIGRIKARPNLWPATVRFHGDDRRLEIAIQTSRPVSEDRYLDGLLYTAWPRLYPRQIQGSDVHLELFDLPRRQGIPARLIRRGYPVDPALKGQRYELGEVFFRLPGRPVEFWLGDRVYGRALSPAELQGHGSDHLFTRPPAAGELAELAGVARRLEVVYHGHPIDVRGLRCGRRLIRVGSQAEPGAA